VSALPVIEHGEGRSSRWLRNNRLRVAILVALVETALVVGNVIGWYIAVAVAAAILAFHFLIGRKSSRPWLRQLSWALAVSQALPVVVPFAALAVGAMIVLGIVGAVFVALAYVVFGRR
jgi:hypothetical protein